MENLQKLLPSPGSSAWYLRTGLSLLHTLPSARAMPSPFSGGNSASGTQVQVKGPLPLITTSCFWGVIWPVLQLFLPDHLLSYKDGFVHDTVPSDIASFYKYFLVDATTLTLTWSWLGIWAPIRPCCHNSWVSFSRKCLERGGTAKAEHRAVLPGALCPSPAVNLSRSPGVRISLPLISLDIVDIFQIPLQCGKRELGPCSSQLNPGPAGREGASSWGHWWDWLTQTFFSLSLPQNVT